MSTVNTISSITDLNPKTSAQDRIPLKTLGQNDFLKLLVAQLAAQDPLNPKKDTDFIAQMAQFSSLEQSKTMQEDLAGLRADQKVSQANALLGSTVVVNKADHTQTGGVVSAINYATGVPQLVIDGQSYTLDQVSAILPTIYSAPETDSSSTSN